MSVHPTDYLVHFSNILLLVSYSVRNILWLRWFAVAAALTNMPYFLYQPSILWPPILWAGVFPPRARNMEEHAGEPRAPRPPHFL